mmetsp:Transcript_3997/g.11977  ORF Transcript_3997/g.11977 Transcript_3997/m.11977 type:complete len:607 (+) Transcript_3997:1550-3370(+)
MLCCGMEVVKDVLFLVVDSLVVPRLSVLVTTADVCDSKHASEEPHPGQVEQRKLRGDADHEPTVAVKAAGRRSLRRSLLDDEHRHPSAVLARVEHLVGHVVPGIMTWDGDLLEKCGLSCGEVDVVYGSRIRERCEPVEDVVIFPPRVRIDTAEVGQLDLLQEFASVQGVDLKHVLYVTLVHKQHFVVARRRCTDQHIGVMLGDQHLPVVRRLVLLKVHPNDAVLRRVSVCSHDEHGPIVCDVPVLPDEIVHNGQEVARFRAKVLFEIDEFDHVLGRTRVRDAEHEIPAVVCSLYAHVPVGMLIVSVDETIARLFFAHLVKIHHVIFHLRGALATVFKSLVRVHLGITAVVEPGAVLCPRNGGVSGPVTVAWDVLTGLKVANLDGPPVRTAEGDCVCQIFAVVGHLDLTQRRSAILGQEVRVQYDLHVVIEAVLSVEDALILLPFLPEQHDPVASDMKRAPDLVILVHVLELLEHAVPHAALLYVLSAQRVLFVDPCFCLLAVRVLEPPVRIRDLLPVDLLHNGPIPTRLWIVVAHRRQPYNVDSSAPHRPRKLCSRPPPSAYPQRSSDKQHLPTNNIQPKQRQCDPPAMIKDPTCVGYPIRQLVVR